MSLLEILQGVIALCRDIAAAPKMPGRFILLATRSHTELNDLLLDLQLEHPALLEKLIIPQSNVRHRF